MVSIDNDIDNAFKKKPNGLRNFISKCEKQNKKKFSVVEFPNFDLNHFQFMNTFKNIDKQMLSNSMASVNQDHSLADNNA